jgi:hypothetical protein
MPIIDVIVPHAPTTFPETDPAFKNEYATGISSTTLAVSINKASYWFFLSFSL